MLTEIRAFHGNNISPFVIEETEVKHEIADYEKAVSTTGYGLFNILMLLAALPVGWTCVLDTTVIPFFIQSTECDFELTLFRRGLAVGTVYIGMIIAGPLWDFIIKDCVLYYLGKRNVMIIGLLLDFICNIFWVHANSYYTFILFKFFNGILIAGPLSVLMPYLSEFHAATYQSTFTKWANLLFATANIFPPALAFGLILHTSWFNFTFFARFYATWRVYMLISTIPSVIGILTLCLMPKSPKFLLIKGQSNEALRVLKTMYSLNKLRSSDSFQIKKLISEHRMKNSITSMCGKTFKDSSLKLKTLLSKPHLRDFLVILSVQFSSMVGFNTIRLWLPQMFLMLNNFDVLVRSYYPRGEKITMCEMMFPRIQMVDYASCNYTLPYVEYAVYVNSTIIGSSAVTFGFIFVLITNTKIKKVFVIIFGFLATTVASFVVNWAIEIPYMLICCASIIVISRMIGNIIVSLNNDVTPQVLRPVANNSINLIGNIGAAVGSILFSVILKLNCLAAFMSIGCLAFFCHVLSYLLMMKPAETNKPVVEKF